MNILFLDTETTGLKKNHLVQLAWEHHPSGERFDGLFLPPSPIEEGAQKVHGISDAMLAEKGVMPFQGSLDRVKLHGLVMEPDTVVVAHNASYDLKVLAQEAIEPKLFICTCKVARKVLPTEPDHKLQGLFSRIKFPVPDEEMLAHNALGDVLVMEGLFAYMYSIEETRGLSEQEILQKWIGYSNEIPSTMPFGKHRGVPFLELPESYVRWLVEQPTMDEKILAAIKMYLPHLA